MNCFTFSAGPIAVRQVAKCDEILLYPTPYAADSDG